MKNEIASFERIFNSSEKGFKVTAELNLRPIIGKNQVKENEHLIEILANESMKNKDGFDIGKGEIGGKYIKLNADYIGKNGQFYEGVDEAGVDRNGVLAHEFGYTGGLIHPFQYYLFNDNKNERMKFNDKYANGNTIYLRNQDDGILINSKNFMNYPKRVSDSLQKQMYFILNPGKATKSQIIAIYSAYSFSNLNFNNIPK
jgi:hypothetical protein